MEWMSTNKLREAFLSFFENKQHYRLKSFSLVPDGDNSLLLINSGMAPMKSFFTAAVTPPSKRITTCQKCVRTPDIERVGITARHGTFFEMLGNFSFGDYFKKEAIEWSYEFFTKILKIPDEKLWYTVYEEDKEAYDIWVNHIGVNENHVVKMDKSSNFWEHGKGPCGPCSEIYYDRGPKYSCGKAGCSVGCECDRYVEVWNLVFTQFYNDGNGNYSTLKQKNIDTGMGLERLACIMQGVDNLFMIDSVKNITNRISKISSVNLGDSSETDIALRIITDHVRSIVFMISDGILPSNEGRGYVLRRLLRRAIRYGKILRINGDFLADVCDAAINENKDAYSELEEKQNFIKKIVNQEESNFRKTLDQGLILLQKIMEESKLHNSKVLDGEKVFKLSDTYGFPFDLTKEIALENNLTVDKDKFDKLMANQKLTARNARKQQKNDTWEESGLNLDSFEKTEFLGYDSLNVESKVLAIIKNGVFCENLACPDEAILVLDKTPFYPESGGQLSDSGVLSNNNTQFEVKNVNKTKNGHYLHYGTLKSGFLQVSNTLSAKVDSLKRADTARNHTAAHLLHAALRKVLGNHVEQAGQQVSNSSLRFDFTHFSALSKQELQKVEKLVLDEIYNSVAVITKEMCIKEAKSSGAMALFGEKYGDIVRVVALDDDFSKELCGGTHVRNTSEITSFKIISESSVAAGVRRIEALTGRGVDMYLNEKLSLLEDIAAILKTQNISDIPSNLQNLLKTLKEKELEIQKLHSIQLDIQAKKLLQSSENVNNLKLICEIFENIDSNNLKMLCDKIRDLDKSVVACFISKCNTKATVLVTAGDIAIKCGVNSSTLIKEIAMLFGGNGGGKAQFAMAGLKDPVSLVDVKISDIKSLIKNILTQ